MPMQAEKTTMTIRRISENIGAEVFGIDLSQTLDKATQKAIYDALVDNIALVFHHQTLTPEQFCAFAQTLGEVMDQDHPKYSFPGLPGIKRHSNQNLDITGKPVKEGLRWHTDGTHRLHPPKFTILHALEVPDKGGNTNVVNMRLGYSTLPADLRQRVDGMQTANVRLAAASKVKHNNNNIHLMAEGKHVPIMHPLVRTNPDNGTKALYFNPNKTEYIVGMSPEESQDFLEDLMERTIRPEFIYSHTWRVGDVLMWDNRSSQHKVNFDYDPNQHRLMHHATVLGERPI